MLTFWKYFWLFFPPLLEIIIINKYWNGSSPPLDRQALALSHSPAQTQFISSIPVYEIKDREKSSLPWKTRGRVRDGGLVTGQGGILPMTKLLPGASNPFPSSWNLGRLSASLLAPLFPPLAQRSFLCVVLLFFL